MTDLLSIGSSGINVYKRALSTVSNNIANIGTEGYSKQVADLNQSTPKPEGAHFLGTGAYFDGVRRQYDSFLESSLQSATADLESQTAAATYSKRLLDLLGDDEIGLTAALNKFFSAAQQVATDPASTAYRASYLRTSEELASRINSLDDQMQALSDQVDSEISADVDSVNVLADQIVEINKQLTKKKFEKDQAPGILDQRDQLLRELSEYSSITTRFSAQGMATVALGTGRDARVLIDGVESRTLKMSSSNAGVVELSVSNLEEDLPVERLGSGSLSGLELFKSTVLKPSRDDLDSLIQTFAQSINDIQGDGLDLNGAAGQPLFVFEPNVGLQSDQLSSNVSVQTRISEAPFPFEIPETVSMQWNASTDAWDVISQSPPRQSFQQISGSSFLFGDLGVTISGEPAPNERVTLQITQGAAESIRVGLTNGDQIAASSAFRVTPDETNRGGRVDRVRFDSDQNVVGSDLDGDISVAGSPGGSEQFVGTLGPGLQAARISIEPNQNASDVSILTRDGTSLIGRNALTSGSSAAQFVETGVVANSDFYTATVSGDSETQYKDWSVQYGSFIPTGQVTQFQLGSVVRSLDSRLSSLESGTLYLSLASNKEYARLNGSTPLSNGSFQFESQNELQDFLDSLVLDSGDDILTSGVPLIGRLSVSVKAHSNDATQIEIDNADEVAYGNTRIDSEELTQSGNLIATPSYRGALNSRPIIPDKEGSDFSASDYENLYVNGTQFKPLDVTGELSAKDVAAWLNGVKDGDAQIFEATAETAIRFEGQQINQALSSGVHGGLYLNGQKILERDEEDASLDTVITKINDNDDLQLLASVDPSGNLVIRSTVGENIEISAAESGGSSILGSQNDRTHSGSYRVTANLESADDLLIEYRADDQQAGAVSSAEVHELLSRIGLSTDIRIQGAIDEQLGVFASGIDVGDTLSVSVQTDASGIAYAEGLRNRQYVVQITQAGDQLEIYERPLATDGNPILDDAGEPVLGSLLSRRPYPGTSGDGTLINYQGIQIQLNAPAIAGDTFVIDGNNTGPGQSFDAQGNNANILRVVDLQVAEITNSQSVSEAYLTIVGSVGNQSTQADLAVSALTVLKDQAIEARDQVSGVNLDEEAAQLIRFQQAYQASAQVMQVATRLFDSILQVR